MGRATGAGTWSGAPASGWPRPGPMSGSIKPFAQAAATNGVFIQGDSNYTVGAGPHFGLMLESQGSPESGFSFIAKFDIANTFTRDRHLFSARPRPWARRHRSVLLPQNFWQPGPDPELSGRPGLAAAEQSQHLRSTWATSTSSGGRSASNSNTHPHQREGRVAPSTIKASSSRQRSPSELDSSTHRQAKPGRSRTASPPGALDARRTRPGPRVRNFHKKRIAHQTDGFLMTI